MDCIYGVIAATKTCKLGGEGMKREEFRKEYKRKGRVLLRGRDAVWACCSIVEMVDIYIFVSVLCVCLVWTGYV